MDRILLAGLLRVDLPGHTMRVCDGGFVTWDGETYLSTDDVFGTPAGFEVPEEGVGDIIPSGTLTMLPPGSAAAIALTNPAYQGSRARFWVLEIDEATGAIIGDPDLQADWQLDRTTLRSKRGSRTVDVDFVSQSQRLLARVEGNVLSSAFHSSIFAGETGFDNATGLASDFAWGAAAPARALVASNTRG